MAKISRDLALGTLHPRETIYAGGTLGALSSEISIVADGAASVTLDLRGTFNLSVEIAGSIDAINWVMIPVRPLTTGTIGYVASIAGSATGVWNGRCAGFRFVRARVTAYGSGAATAVLASGTAPLDEGPFGQVTPAIVTATGAAGAAVTLTIPTAGAGLRHYLTYLSFQRFAGAALSAAATPVTVSTTNVPGPLAIAFPADALAAGSIDRWREEFAFPIATTTPNSVTTIICPATTNVIWRISAGYFVGP